MGVRSHVVLMHESTRGPSIIPTFINNEIRKFGQTFKFLLITNGDFVRRNNEGEVRVAFEFWIQRPLEHGITGRGRAVVSNDGVRRHPLLELADPIGQSRQWSNNHEWSTDTLCQEMRNQSDTLDCFT